jgi:hypothetical protein
VLFHVLLPLPVQLSPTLWLQFQQGCFLLLHVRKTSLRSCLNWSSGARAAIWVILNSSRLSACWGWVECPIISFIFHDLNYPAWSLWQMSRPRKNKTNEQTSTIAYFYSSRRKTWGTQGTGVHGRENIFGLIWTSNHFWVDLDVTILGPSGRKHFRVHLDVNIADSFWTQKKCFLFSLGIAK